MNLDIYFFARAFLHLLAVLWQAGAALPLIMALGLIIGRRGHAGVCLWGTRCLCGGAMFLAIAASMFFPLSYLLALAPHGWDNLWEPLLTLAGLPWSSAFAAWFAGIAALGAAIAFLGRCPAQITGNRYQFAIVKMPFIFFILAAACFFMTFCLINWPFAGLPRDLPWDRAVLAVWRNAAHHYFMALTPAALVALAIYAWSSVPQAVSVQETGMIWRWLALWGVAGWLPGCLQSWGFMLGLGLRGNLAGNLAQGMDTQLAMLICMSFILIGCIAIFLRKKATVFWVCALLALLFIRALMPEFLQIWHTL